MFITMTQSNKNPPPHHCMVVFARYPLGETRVQREAEALVKHGYKVDVICIRWQGEKASDFYKGVRIYREEYQLHFPLSKTNGLKERFLNYLRFFVSAFIRVTKLHLRNHYCTIQVHNLPDFLVFCALIPKLMGVPIIIDLHDLMPEFFVGRFGQTGSLLAKLIRFQEHLACRFADHVLTVSDHWRQALIGRGVPENKCSVVMNVADDQIFLPFTDNHHFSKPLSGFRLIYHGSIHYRYGLDLIIEAVNRLQNVIPGIHLSILGIGEFLPKLHELVEIHQLQKYVSFESFRPAEELPNIIRACHLGVVPYRNDIFTDGLLPTKLMEYAALGMPSVAARTTAIKSYFSDTNVEFFEPGDVDDLVCCILRLYDNSDRMAELAHGSQNFNQRYNWTTISLEYVALVERLCAKRERGIYEVGGQNPPNTSN